MPRKNILLALFLAALVITAYIPALKAGFIWDDDSYLTANKTLASPDGLSRTWFSLSANPQYYPLVFTSFLLERSLWGVNPLPYHAANVLLHLLGSLILWRVLKRLGLPGAWLAAAVFALHPMNVESVAWITERKNVLSGFFYFSSAFCLARFFGFGPKTGNRTPSFWYAAALLLFLAALLSKTVTSVLPAAFVAILWWKNGAVKKTDWARLAPFFALALAFGSITAWVERHHVGAAGGEWDLTFPERIIVAGKALWFYIGKILLPVNLSFIYPRFSTDAANFVSWLFPAAFILFFAALFSLRGKIGRGPATAIACFAMALFPSLGFFNVFPHRYSFVADHFAYHALPFFIALVVCGGAGLLERLRQKPPRAAMIAPAALLAFLAASSSGHAGVFTSLETLWSRTIKSNPSAWIAHNNLGVYLDQAGREAEALAHLEKSLEIRPDLPEVHYNLAGYYGRKGNRAKAAEHLEQALSLETSKDDVHYQLGLLLLEKGRKQEALVRFLKAAKANPSHAQALYEAGALFSEAGDRRALYYFQKALAIKPTMAQAHHGIGRVLAASGDAKGAEKKFRTALVGLPGEATIHNDLGAILVAEGRESEAMESFKRAVSLNPRYAEAITNLALLLVKAGEKDEALARYRQALHVEEKNPETHYNIGVLLIAKGGGGEAFAHFARAAELAPNFPEARFALGRELFARNRFAEAEPHLKAAVALAPDFLNAREELVKFLWLTGRPDRARKELAEMNRLDPALSADLEKWMKKTRPEKG